MEVPSEAKHTEACVRGIDDLTDAIASSSLLEEDNGESITSDANQLESHLRDMSKRQLAHKAGLTKFKHIEKEELVELAKQNILKNDGENEHRVSSKQFNK